MKKRRYPTTAIAVNGPALRELRIRTGIEVKDFADQVGVSRSYVTKVELGHSRRVSPEVYNKILTVLGIRDRRTLLADLQDVA